MAAHTRPNAAYAIAETNPIAATPFNAVDLNLLATHATATTPAITRPVYPNPVNIFSCSLPIKSARYLAAITTAIDANI